METSSDPIWPKTYCIQSPTPMMLQMKFDFDQPASLRDIYMFESVDPRMDERLLESHLISCSGELKNLANGYRDMAPDIRTHRQRQNYIPPPSAGYKNKVTFHKLLFVLW